VANVGQVYELNMVVKDSDNDTSLMSLYLGVEGAGDEPGIEAMIDIATTMVGYMQPLLGGHIESASMSIPLVVFDSGAPDSNSDVEEGAQFNFRADDTRKVKLLRLPTFKESKLDAGNRAVNLADTDVDTWLDAMLEGFDVNEGLDTITVRATDSEGRLLNAVRVANEDFRDRRRRR
jgi:hypothetical protein